MCHTEITVILQVKWLVITEVLSESFGLVTQLCHDVSVLCVVTHTFAYWMSPVSARHVIFFNVECGIAWLLCGMRVVEVWASHRLPLCNNLFLPWPPLLSYLVQKNCILNQSLNHSLTQSLIQFIWCAGSRSFRTSEYLSYIWDSFDILYRFLTFDCKNI